jgi:hypothetical protein
MSRQERFKTRNEIRVEQNEADIIERENWNILKSSTDLSAIKDSLYMVENKSKKVRLNGDHLLVSREKISPGQYVCSLVGKSVEVQNASSHCPFDTTFQCHTKSFPLLNGTILEGYSPGDNMGCFASLKQDSFNCAIAQDHMTGTKSSHTFLYCVNTIKSGDEIICEGTNKPFKDIQRF